MFSLLAQEEHQMPKPVSFTPTLSVIIEDPNEGQIIDASPPKSPDLGDGFDSPRIELKTPKPLPEEASQMLNTCLELFDLLKLSDPDLVKACVDMEPTKLLDLGARFTSLSKEHLGMFSNDQLTRLVTRFLGTGFVNARMKNPDCKDVTQTQIALLYEKLPYEVQNELGL
jgi:hypothetical protein